jgi:hypothetical protein
MVIKKGLLLFSGIWFRPGLEQQARSLPFDWNIYARLMLIHKDPLDPICKCLQRDAPFSLIGLQNIFRLSLL